MSTENKSKYFIYITVNKINGKIYIGKHKKGRENYLGSGRLIKKAIKKYGRLNFLREILCYCDTIEELDAKEIFYIKDFGSNSPGIGYNVVDFPFSSPLMKKTKMFKKNHRKAILEYVASDRGIANAKKRGERMKANFRNDSYKQRHIEILKKSCGTKEWRERMSKQTTAFLKTDEAKAHLKSRLEGIAKFNLDPERKAAAIKKQSESIKRFYASEEGIRKNKLRIEKSVAARMKNYSYPSSIPVSKYSACGTTLIERYRSAAEAARENGMNVRVFMRKKIRTNFLSDNGKEINGFLWKIEK